MPTEKRREVGDSAHSDPQSPPPDLFECRWERIRASTAKCDVCGKRNTKGSIMRCEHCRWQTCHSTCLTDTKCTHRRDRRRCAHQCNHESHDDDAPDYGTRRARLAAANAGSARPKLRHVSIRGRARANTMNGRTSSRSTSIRRGTGANAGASNASLHSDHGSGSSIRTARARRPGVSRHLVVSASSSRAPSASGSGDRSSRAIPLIIPSRAVGSTNASNREISLLYQTDLITARSGLNSPSLSSEEADTSSSGLDISYSINPGERNTASSPSSVFSGSPPSMPSSPSSPYTVAGENDDTRLCAEENPQSSDANITKEDLDGAERLLALRIQVDIESDTTRGGKCGNYNVHNPRACAFTLAKERRQGWERVSIPQRKRPAQGVRRNIDDNGDDEDDDERRRRLRWFGL